MYEDTAWTYPVLMAAGSVATLDRVCVHHRLRRHGSLLGATTYGHFDVFGQYDRVFAYVDERPELAVLKELGVTLVEIKLTDNLPAWAITLVLNTEASCVFDDLTRRGITAGLNSWPNSFRQGQFTPAVEYLRAMRARTLLMRDMENLMSQVDLYVGGDDLAITNLTGHPCVVLPCGFEEQNGVATPTAATFTGRLYDETTLLALAHAFQQATDFHLRRPPLEKLASASENNEN